ncbi:MFS transporter [Oryzibacter oryziterrae]|uniref:MFS transporter n=1 Tax=Oryzibacter oryziterrae TaxID=2766474 RepID=UPI001F1C10AE|nr:MFS transporter [Oryzibacter oryziterrae]
MTHPDAAVSPNAFHHRAFLLYWIARLFASFAVQIVVVAIGWKVYALTSDPFALGLVGLMEFMPSVVLVLFTGAVADRFERRLIVSACLALELLCVIGFFAHGWVGAREVLPIYGLLLVLGVARAFLGPSLQAMVPNMVPRVALSSAVSWTSASWQVATIGGPVVGGLLFGLSEFVAYGTAIAMFVLGIALMLALPMVPQTARQGESTWDSVSAGFRYVFTNRIVLGAISLDLFAVLLGGAVALMPVYAKDILVLGPLGLGLLRSAPGIGAIAVTLWLATFPIKSAAGLKMFAGVGLFGLGTLVFGISTSPALSIAMLALMGAGDMVSVYVRETLIQLATPDDVRGRVSAVNMVFVGASNELGEFRAGTMAALIGVIPAVVVGGVGTMLVAFAWAAMFPELRKAERLDGS